MTTRRNDGDGFGHDSRGKVVICCDPIGNIRPESDVILSTFGQLDLTLQHGWLYNLGYSAELQFVFSSAGHYISPSAATVQIQFHRLFPSRFTILVG